MFFDIHAHVYKYQYPTPQGFDLFVSPEDLSEMHKELSIDRAVLLPVVSSEEYMPQSVGEIIDIAAASGGKWIPFCNIDPRVYSNNSDAPIGMLLEFYAKQGCRGIGEVMPNLEWQDPRMQNLLHCTEEFGFPLLFDTTGRKNSGYGLYDDAGLPQLEASIKSHPRLTFIGHGPAFWSEFAPIAPGEDHCGYPTGPMEAEGRVWQLMRTYPNLWVDLSAESGYKALTRNQIFTEKFLNEFCDRILFGTDICRAGQKVGIGKLLLSLRETEKISVETFEKIAFRNAERLLGLPASDEK